MLDEPTQTMLRLLSGYWATQSLYVIAELGIADRLSDGPKTAGELAAETACDEAALYRLLRGLASAGVFTEDGAGRFALTPLSQTLRADVRDSVRSVALLGGHPLHWTAWGSLLHSVRTGQTAFDAAHGRPFFDALAEDPTLSEIFQDVLARLEEVDRAVADAADVRRFERIVDVGGGRGGLARQVAQAHPDASVVLLDREPVLASVPASERVALVAGDFFDGVPEGGDAYFLKFVLHDWNDERARKILENCGGAMADEGRLFIVEVLVPDDPTPSYAKIHDVNMLVLTGGRERTLAEYDALLERARLERLRVTATAHGVSVIEARRAPGADLRIALAHIS